MRDYLLRGSDPSSVQVLLEDSSSVIGTLIAGASLTASWYFQNPMLDSAGSIVIGGLLSSVAVFLIRRNLKMVVETSLPPHQITLLSRVVSTDPVVQSIQDIKSSSYGPEHARFKAEISFNSHELTRRYITLKELDMHNELGTIKGFESARQLEAYLVQFSGGVVEQLGDEIDRIEDNIKDVVPEVKHVDLEVL